MAAAKFVLPDFGGPDLEKLDFVELAQSISAGNISREYLSAFAEIVLENRTPAGAMSSLRGIMEMGKAPRDEIWHARFAEIPALVESAVLRVGCVSVGIGTNGSGPAIVSVDDVLTREDPPQQFIWGEYIPTNALTLLAAHGGVGKSGLALQLAMHVSAGVGFLDAPVARATTLYFSAEDPASVVRSRLARLCRHYEVNPADLATNLHILDATGCGVLFEEDAHEGETTLTETFAALAAFIVLHRIRFLVVDNSSDTFAGNPIDRAQVTRFIRELGGLVKRMGGAVLLLSHVAKTTARAGARTTNTEGYADSAAWNNASRSRLFMFEDGERVILEHQKSNYAAKADPLHLVRLQGCGFELAHAQSQHPPGSAEAHGVAALKLLKMVHEYYTREEWISVSPSSPGTNAHAMLKNEPEFPTTSKSQTMTVFRDMQRQGLIEVETYKRRNRHTGERWVVTDAGLARIQEQAQ